jgi:hypothetical protein
MTAIIILSAHENLAFMTRTFSRIAALETLVVECYVEDFAIEDRQKMT